MAFPAGSRAARQARGADARADQDGRAGRRLGAGRRATSRVLPPRSCSAQAFPPRLGPSRPRPVPPNPLPLGGGRRPPRRCWPGGPGEPRLRHVGAASSSPPPSSLRGRRRRRASRRGGCGRSRARKAPPPNRRPPCQGPRVGCRVRRLVRGLQRFAFACLMLDQAALVLGPWQPPGPGTECGRPPSPAGSLFLVPRRT